MLLSAALTTTMAAGEAWSAAKEMNSLSRMLTWLCAADVWSAFYLKRWQQVTRVAVVAGGEQCAWSTLCVLRRAARRADSWRVCPTAGAWRVCCCCWVESCPHKISCWCLLLHHASSHARAQQHTLSESTKSCEMASASDAFCSCSRLVLVQTVVDGMAAVLLCVLWVAASVCAVGGCLVLADRAVER
jgi:hypothetical protein